MHEIRRLPLKRFLKQNFCLIYLDEVTLIRYYNIMLAMVFML